MDRRTFFSTLASSALVAMTPELGAEVQTVRFQVAGVRFHADAAPQPAGARLNVKAEQRGHELALALLSAGGEQIGYVPQHLTASLSRDLRAVRVIEARRHALPWKRYLVEATLA